MPIGMVGFSMLMFLRETYGTFEHAGSAVGLGFVAMAAAAPVQGRFIDRFGPRTVLRITGLVQPLSLVGIIVAAKLGMPFAVVVAFSALSGAFASPITTLTRTLWRYRFDNEEDRRIAYALDAVTPEERLAVERYLLVNPKARAEVEDRLHDVQSLVALAGIRHGKGRGDP